MKQPTGYSAFYPVPLPPVPPLQMDDELWTLLSNADMALGRLDGVTEILPNPDLFASMYIRKEAVLSSQIEGTQASLTDVLDAEAQLLRPDRPSDAEDVFGYIRAVRFGLERIKALPLSLRLIRELHRELLEKGARGSDKGPGEFRRSQNWIGPGGCTLATATFVPPPSHELLRVLGELETFLHDPSPMPVLLKIALVHAQFETIHPFLDGNGRVGRLLIIFLLIQERRISQPLLYPSLYFKLNRTEYYDRLQAVRDHGAWEQWVKFFLRGIVITADQASFTSKHILRLREKDRSKVLGLSQGGLAGTLLDMLFDVPSVTTVGVGEMLGVAFPTASKLLKNLEDLGILEEVSGKQRGKVYVYRRYLDLFTGDGV